MINVWEEPALEPQIWPGSNRSLQQVTWHKNHVMAYKMSSWHSLSRWYFLDISSNRLFKAATVCDSIETKSRPFLKIKFANRGIDALNLSNILNQKSVQSNIPPYFEYKESPCISYSYTSSVDTKIFNYKTSLQQIDFQSLSQNPLPCSCSGTKWQTTRSVGEERVHF